MHKIAHASIVFTSFDMIVENVIEAEPPRLNSCQLTRESDTNGINYWALSRCTGLHPCTTRTDELHAAL